MFYSPTATCTIICPAESVICSPGVGTGGINIVKTSSNSSDLANMFASGEIAYILQNEQNENIWGQKIGEENLPVLGGLKVYQNKAYSGCEGNKGDAG